MYVTNGTTQKEIKNEIKRIEAELQYPAIPAEVRESLHEELDYLYSFVQEEDQHDTQIYS